MKHIIAGTRCRDGGHRVNGVRFLFWMIFPLVILTGCGIFQSSDKGAEAPGVFIAAEWNVQALFDGYEKGNEYSEYREAAGWTAEKYAARITAISQAVQQMVKETVPDFIGFIEIENAGALDDLCRGSLAKHGYFWNAFANLPGASLGLGVLSRFPLLEVRAHSITVEKQTAPRPVLELRVAPGGKPLVFLLCHWKSKLGGEDATEAMRRSSARVVQRRLRELRESEAETPVIVMGDLNENHDEFYRRSVFSALLPDDPDAAAMAIRAPKEFLVLSREKPPRSRFFEGVPALYSPWGEELADGSYCYRDNWETIDHLLLSDALFTGSGWDYADSRVLNHAPFAASNGFPDTYVPRTGRGLSDHLPLLLYLRDSTGKTGPEQKRR